MSQFHRILLVVNPVSGLSQGMRIGLRLLKRLQGEGYHCVVRKTTAAGDAAEWARTAGQEGFDLVFAIGGDGTLREVAAAMVGAPVAVPIAHVPVGTANIIAIALNLPWTSGHVADMVKQGQVVPFDVGYLPERNQHFLLMAAIGYPAKIIQDSPRRLKNMFGALTYVGAAFRNIFLLDHARLEIEADGEVEWLTANTVLVSNIGRIRNLNLRVTPDTSPHDGKFDLTIISSRTLWDFLRVLLRLLTWRYPAPRLQHRQARRVTIRGIHPVPVQIDGEVIGSTPLQAEVLHHAIRLLVPKGYR